MFSILNVTRFVKKCIECKKWAHTEYMKIEYDEIARLKSTFKCPSCVKAENLTSKSEESGNYHSSPEFKHELVTEKTTTQPNVNNSSIDQSVSLAEQLNTSNDKSQKKGSSRAYNRKHDLEHRAKKAQK